MLLNEVKINIICQIYFIFRSLACTVYEMATTKPPWGELPPEAAMFQIGIGQSVPGLPDHLSVELKTLFSACLSRYVIYF